MKKFFVGIFIAIFSAQIFLPIDYSAAAEKKEGQSVGVETQSKSVFLFDVGEEKQVFEKNPDQIMPLASLTKLMTALVIYQNQPKWDDWVKIEPSDMKKKGGIPHIIAGEEIKKEDLWNLMLVASSNEAAAALARGSGMSEEKFAAAMNQQAEEFGLRKLVFSDPTGLDPKNQGTAREIAALARVVFSLPKVRASLTKTSYSFTPRGKKTRRVKSTNVLLSSFLNQNPYQIISGKTGYLEESQYNLVFAAGKIENNSSDKKNKQLVGVVLGSPTSDERFQEMKGLIYWGFERRGMVAR